MEDSRTTAGGTHTAYTDPKVPRRLVPLAWQSLRLHLVPGEQVLGMFSVTRLRRSLTMLVVTDQRLLTLGDEHVGMPLVDEVHRDHVSEVAVERDRVFSVGLVTARTTHGEVNLGTLTHGKETFIRLDEVLAARPDRPMPLIPMPGEGGGPVEELPTHPLVAHLTALADLHERGALTDAEFATAKARLLADPLQ